MASETGDIPVGARVTAVGKQGIVRFVGQTEFSTGVWVGIELDGPDGKNNGSVKGVKYFEVPQNYGLFVRASQVEVQKDAEAGSGSASSASDRLAALRQKKAAALASRDKIRGTTPLSVDNKKPSIRKSITPRASQSAGKGQSSTSVAPALQKSQSDLPSGSTSQKALQSEISALEGQIAKQASEINDLKQQLDEANSSKTETNAGESEKIALQEQISALTKQIEEVKSDLEIERKDRQAASDELRILKDMKENFSAEEKGKLADQAREKAALVSALRKVSELENQIMELTDEMEVLTLDKETLQIEKEDVEERLEEAKLEAEAAKLELEHSQLAASEKAEVEQASEGADAIDLREQNTKMREALKKLAEISQSEKADFTKKIRSLEKEAVLVPQLKAEVESLKQWKEHTIAELEETRDQVITSEAFEEILEQMTEKNLDLETKVSELSVKVEDLENTLELSEEIEQSQAEEIKGLQSDLNANEVKVANVENIIAAKDKEVADAKETMERFRALVDELQAQRSSLEDKAAAGEEELESLKGRAQGVLAQNLSLQSLATQQRKQQFREASLSLRAAVAEAKAARWNLLLPAVLIEQEQINIESDFLLARIVMKGLGAVASIANGMDSWAAEARSGGKMDEQKAEIWSHAIDIAQLILKGAMEAHTMLTFVVSPETEEKASGAASVSAREAFAVLENVIDGIDIILSEEGMIPLHLSSSGDLEEALHNCKQVHSDLNLPWTADQEYVKIAYSLQAAITYAYGASAQAAFIFGVEDVGGASASLKALESELQKVKEKGNGSTENKLSANNNLSTQVENLRDTVRGLHTKVSSFTTMVPEGEDTAGDAAKTFSVGLCEDIQRIRERVREVSNDDTPVKNLSDILNSSTVWGMLAPTDSRQNPNVPYAVRAKTVNDTIEEALSLRPQLKTAQDDVKRLMAGIEDKDKEILSLAAVRANLERLVEKETAQKVAAEDMLNELDEIRTVKGALEKENKTLQEAVEVLTQQVSELDDEKRALQKSGLQKGKKGSSSSLTGMQQNSGTGVSFEELATLQAALRYTRNETAYWRSKATCTLLKELDPLPRVVAPEQKYARRHEGRTQMNPADSETQIASYLSSLSELEKEVQRRRAAPKIVALGKGSARAQLHRMQVETGHLQKELNETSTQVQSLIRSLQSETRPTLYFHEASSLPSQENSTKVIGRLSMKSSTAKEFAIPQIKTCTLGTEDLRKLYSMFVPQ